MTLNWIFEDLSKGDIFKRIKGKMSGCRMVVNEIDYKLRTVTLSYYCGLGFGMRTVKVSADELHNDYILAAWHK